MSKVASRYYYLAKSDYFPNGQLYLREAGSKVFGVQQAGFDELLLMDFNMTIGDTLVVAPTLKYTFAGSYFDKALKEQVFRFELLRNARDFAGDCNNDAFEVTRRQGYIKLEYNCDNGRNFHCTMMR